MNLRDYLDKHGEKTKLAIEIGAQAQLVWQWAAGVRVVPIGRCYAIEQATNGVVTRRDLRPNDWQKIWPELAQTQCQPTTT